MRHHSGRVESHRRPPGSLARSPVRRGDAVRLAAVTRPAHDRARAAAGRAALGAGRRHAQPRRRADDPAGRRARPRGPRHLRALVRARRPAEPAGYPRRGARPLCAPPAQGPGLHDRGCRQTARLRSGEDAPAARAQVSRPHRRRNAPVADGGRGDRPHRPGIPDARASRGGERLMMSSPPRKPATVLIVDDEAGLRRVLERHGYRVLSAGTAESAYEMLAAETADALLLDIHLPTMSGLALYLAIIHRWPALEGHIAIMTGDAEAHEVRTWLDHHHCTVIRKPFNLQQVADWVSSALQRDRSSDAMDA